MRSYFPSNSTWFEWKRISIGDLNDYVSWTQQNVLGAKNLFAWNKVNDIFVNNNTTGHETTTSHTIADGVITVVNASTSDTHHKGIYVPKSTINPMLEALEGVPITLSCDVKFNTSVTNFRFGMDSGSSYYTVGTDFVHIEKTLTFESSLANNLIFYIPSTSAYTFYVKNIMIRLASITDNTYEDFAKTNQQLTKAVHTYEMGKEITTSGDLNDYRTEGVYYVHTDVRAQSLTNIPVQNAGKLIVSKIRNTDNFVQSYILYYNGLEFKRTYSGGSWTSWKTIAFKEDISPSVIGNGYAVATVSGSAISATITGFQLRAGVIVSIKINADISSATTLNINNTGAKYISIWENASPSIGTKIMYGSICTFIYDGTYYRLIARDRIPYMQAIDYVADTSGNFNIYWGWQSNVATLKHYIADGTLKFNYYKNGAWRGDRELFQNNFSSYLTFYKETTNSEDGYVSIGANFKDTENNKTYGVHIIRLYKDHQASPYDIYGLNMVMQSGGQMIIGSGESAQALYGVLTDKTSENLFLESDGGIALEAGGSTIANRKGIFLSSSGSIYPMSGGFGVDGQVNLGVDVYPFGYIYSNNSHVVRRNNVDLKQSNNGLSSDDSLGAVIGQDKNSKNYMVLFSEAYTNGNTSTKLRLRNFDSSGNMVVNGGIDMYANKSGVFWYWVKAPNNFLASLGTGYAYCDTAESTTAKVASMSYYTLAVNGYVTVYFQYNVPANATLNINNQGAKSIYWRSNAITANVIRAGDKATFIYYDSKYHLLSVDRGVSAFVYSDSFSSSSSGAVIHLKGVQTLKTYTLSTGIWIINYREQFNPASLNAIAVGFSASQKTSSGQFGIPDGIYHDVARTGALQSITFSKTLNVSGSTTYYLQHSWGGSANLTSAYAYVEILKVG